MKYFYLILFILMCGFTSVAQTKTVIVTLNNSPLPFANISYFDSKDIVVSTDENGRVDIPRAAKSISISHVSCLTKFFSFTGADSLKNTIVIELEKRVGLEDAVTILAEPKIKKKFSAGNFSHTPNYYWIFHPGTNFICGFLMRYPASHENLYVKNFIFKLRNIHNTHLAKESYMEIKFFALQPGSDTVSCPPLNTLPIIIPFSSLRKMNEIKLEESILLPQEIVLVSFELKNTNNVDKSVNFEISGRQDSDIPVMFIAPANVTDWGCNRLPRPFKTITEDGHFFNPDVKIEFQNYKVVSN